MKYLLKTLLLASLPLISLQAATSDQSTSGSILYMMQSSDPTKAIEQYFINYEKTGTHDFEVLQQMSQILLDQGFRSRDAETLVLTIFGAGTSTNEKMLYILESGLSNPNPQVQLISLNFLARYQNDRADDAINKAMSSNFLPIRLEAAYHLAQKKYPTACGQTEALMHKVDKKVWFVFPQIFAAMGDTSAIRMLRRLMNDSDESVRIEAILNAAKYGRDDLLSKIRTLSTHMGLGQQEACAVALGIMKDEASAEQLQKMSKSGSPHVQLAALLSLYQLGRKEVKEQIERAAQQEDLFAIAALAHIPETGEVLNNLVKSSNPHVRVNAALSLLEQRDPRCLTGVMEILIRDQRDFAFTKISSTGKGLSAWKVVPSAQQKFEANPVLYELSVNMRETALAKTVDLPEEDFLRLANVILELQQNDLIPTTVRLLENLRTPNAIALLKKYQQKIGAPLIRNYCNLALYKLKEEGPYGDNLRQWISQKQHIDMIQFRPFIPWEMRQDETVYQLTPRETSQLLIESIEALSQDRDNASITALLLAIQHGNAKNKYALAGLLMRAIQ